ncbi:MAG: DNA polymerase III subunit gamma/tau [Rhodoferax sp.]
MSYLVLARKYRPRNFAEMVGQNHVVQALSNALTTQRLHHAYLFTGTRGVGKTTVSRILAKSLNCQGSDGQGGITAAPCGVCQACRDIDAGRFVDYTELDAASNRGVDEVQALLEQAVYKPVQGRFKVFMIDEVHMLTNTAFNAMLKTLEEPPDYLKFVLATTDPQKVPVTVLSRCLQFNLRPMAPETIREHLTEVLGQESVSAEPQALRLLARAARGSMRDALSLTDQAIAFGSGALSEATVRTMLGSVDRGYIFRLIEALALGDGRSVVQTVDTLRLNGLNAASTLEEMASVLQRMAVLQTMAGTGAAGDDDSDTEAADVARLAALLPADETQLLYSICLHGRGDLGLAPDEYAAWTRVLLRWLAFKPAHAQVLEQPTPIVEKKSLNDADTGSDKPVAVSPSAVNASTANPAPVLVSAKSDEIYSPTGAAPPGHILPVRGVQPWEEAGDEVEETDVAVDVHVPAAPVAAQPKAVDHRVVGVPVRQQSHSQVDAQASAQAVPVLLPTEEGDFWHATVQALIEAQAIGAMVRELALQSQLVARDEGQWLLRVERESLNQAGSRDRLTVALKDAGFDVALAVEVGRVTDSPGRRNARASAERQQAAEQLIYATPLVQKLINDFGAKVVPGSIRPL